jgi:DNA-binding GntR family transcriptional regulator
MRAPEHKTKSEVALEALRFALIRGELGEDRRLTLAELQESLGMSSTPIREAIRILETEGLLQNEPHRGVRVRSMTLSEVAEVYLLRAPLERIAGELAAQGLTDQHVRALERAQDKFKRAATRGDDAAMTRTNTDFHYVIYGAAGSRHLQRIIAQLWVPYSWGAKWGLTGAPESVEEHAGIVEALERRDGKTAGQRLEQHTLRVYKTIANFARSERAAEDGSSDGVGTRPAGADQSVSVADGT